MHVCQLEKMFDCVCKCGENSIQFLSKRTIFQLSNGTQLYALLLAFCSLRTVCIFLSTISRTIQNHTELFFFSRFIPVWNEKLIYFSIKMEVEKWNFVILLNKSALKEKQQLEKPRNAKLWFPCICEFADEKCCCVNKLRCCVYVTHAYNINV